MRLQAVLTELLRRPECEEYPGFFPYDMSNHAVLTLMQLDGVDRRGGCCRVQTGPGGTKSETIMAYLSALKTNLRQLMGNRPIFPNLQPMY